MRISVFAVKRKKDEKGKGEYQDFVAAKIRQMNQFAYDSYAQEKPFYAPYKKELSNHNNQDRGVKVATHISAKLNHQKIKQESQLHQNNG